MVSMLYEYRCISILFMIQVFTFSPFYISLTMYIGPTTHGADVFVMSMLVICTFGCVLFMLHVSILCPCFCCPRSVN